MLVDALLMDSCLMLTSELQFDLPSSLIAQSPSDQRDGSRLLVYNRQNNSVSHHHFHEFPDVLPPQLAILRNDVSVLKARLPGKRPTGGAVECLLLRPADPPETSWRCLLKPGGKTARVGSFELDGEYQAEILESLPSGEYLVRFDLPKDKDAPSLAQRIGSLPLPPYVRRPADTADEERYQTVYAKDEKRSAVAAPTAGLHFTDQILNQLQLEGHQVHDLTLSVGLGTFRPIETEKVEDHPMHAEEYFLSPQTKAVLRDPSVKRLAIGTTCVRAIEHYLSTDDPYSAEPTRADARLFIRPPYNFLGVDHLLTNFHLPGSTLLCLVSAFLTPGSPDGLDRLKELYKEEIDKKYRFFSYGDAMLIL
jgi:S-adenosylmethionine:tRNA ribosyltransferase-isomerase